MLKRVIVCLVVLRVLCSGIALAQNTVRYIYDDLGRLIGVIDQNGDAATYNYDAVGNLLSITRTSASTVSIIAFTPGSGAIGATITISGTGFSSTPSSNTVTFNGTAATVSTATANQLVVTVPSGATTGAIVVTAPGGSATSATVFTVVSGSLAPTITSFWPTGGVAGTAVTVSGTNFDSVIANNRTRFNATYASLSSGNSTTLSTGAPSNTGSGHISVATPYGTAVSTDDFLSPPSPYGVADVQVFGRIAFATATGVTISTLNKVGVMLFDSSPGHRMSIRGTNGVSGHVFGCDIYVTLYHPNATILAQPTCMEGSGFIDAVAAPITGTFTLLVDPADTVTGSVTLTVYDVPADAGGTITPGGSAVTVTTTTPGQNGALTFSGTAGHRVSLRGTNGMSGQIVGCDVNVSILNPDKTVLAAPTCMEGSGYIDVVNLATTGTYTVKMDPVDIATGSLTLTLYDVPADTTGTITPGGSPVTVTTTAPGQNGSLTFSGTAGQVVSLKGTGWTIGQVSGCDVNVTILNPDSTVLAATTCMESAAFIDTKTLPATGTYTIQVDPQTYATGSLMLTLYSVPADAGGTITAGGSPVTVTTTTPGQNAALTFSGTSGQRISLRGTNGMSGQVAFACDVNVTILKPDSTTLAGPTCMETSGFIDATTLTATGTYTIKIDPADVAVGSLTLTLYSITDVSGTITEGGSPVTVTTTTPGQNGALTFSGTAGDRISLQGTNGMTGQIAFACDVFVSILNPNGSTLASQTCMEGSGFIDVVTLGSTGTYTIKVDPADIAVGSVTLTLYNVPADASGSVSVGGSSLTLTTTTPGQNALATFSGTSSQQVTVHLTSNSTGSVTVKLLKPDGTQLTSTTSSAASFNLSTQTLPSTGTYTIVVDPGGTSVGSITINVTNP